MRAWRATFSARAGSGTRITPRPRRARERPRASSRDRSGPVTSTGQPNPAATASTPAACGVAKSVSKVPGSSSVAGAEEVEDPPAGVVGHDDGEGGGEAGRGTRAETSWRKARSPTRATVGPPEARATPRAVDTTPSIPFAPRLATTRGPSAPGAAKASTSRTGIEEETTRVLCGRQMGDQPAGQGRLGHAPGAPGRRGGTEGPLDGGLGGGLGAPPTAPSTRPTGGRPDRSRRPAAADRTTRRQNSEGSE